MTDERTTDVVNETKATGRKGEPPTSPHSSKGVGTTPELAAAADKTGLSVDDLIRMCVDRALDQVVTDYLNEQHYNGNDGGTVVLP